MLQGKSVHELRSIAQGYGIPDLFSKDVTQLVQEIEIKQQAMIPEPPVTIPKAEYDARLMTKPPARKTNRQLFEEIITPYVARGLRIDFPDEETWAMYWGKKNDSGPMRMPARHILAAADRIMKSNAVVREWV